MVLMYTSERIVGLNRPERSCFFATFIDILIYIDIFFHFVKFWNVVRCVCALAVKTHHRRETKSVARNRVEIWNDFERRGRIKWYNYIMALRCCWLIHDDRFFFVHFSSNFTFHNADWLRHKHIPHFLWSIERQFPQHFHSEIIFGGKISYIDECSIWIANYASADHLFNREINRSDTKHSILHFVYDRLFVCSIANK